MPISEKRSASDGVMVPYKKPRTDIISYGGESHDTSVSARSVYYSCTTDDILCCIINLL